MHHFAKILEESIGLEFEPVGVKFYSEKINQVVPEKEQRLCQAVMQARHGQTVVITKENLTCPAAAAALGLKPLPSALQDGTMLRGFGIFAEKPVGARVMQTMPRLEPDAFAAIEIKPLASFSSIPDVIVLEDQVEKLMWVALAYLNEEGGRLQFSTSVLQAVCVDAVVIPFRTQKINMSVGCYGCRDATDAMPGEAVIGFPGAKLEMVVKNLTFLQRQAIGKSRAKNVFFRESSSNII